MPSALETLMKILKLEREQGYKNTAVIGGLDAYAENWQGEAHAQAKRPEHHVLVDELAQLLRDYDAVQSREKRHDSIKYMMDRMTGRIPPPPELLKAGLGAVDAGQAPAAPVAPPSAAPVAQSPADRPARRKKQRRTKAADSAAQKTPQAVEAEYADPLEAEPELPATPPEPIDEPHPKPRRKARRVQDQATALEHLHGLAAPVTVVEGVGDKMAEKLARLGVTIVGDLLYHVPRRYDDYTRLLPISKTKPGEMVTLIGTIRDSRVLKGRGGNQFLQIKIDDGTAVLAVFFFGQPYLQNQLQRGVQLVVSGKTDLYLGQLSMNNPEWELLEVDNLHTRSIVPVYPLTKGLTARTMRRILKKTVDYWSPRIPDYVPESVLDRAELVELGWALRQIHFPANGEYINYAHERLAFDELFLLQMAMLERRREWQQQPGVPLPVADEWLTGILDNLPFALTDAQKRVVDEIRADMAVAVPMNRLLQGDVGSGKTIVALLAMLLAVQNGGQVALMAPTSILAEQHFQAITETLATLVPDREIKVRLLTGATTQSEREEILWLLGEGTISILIGTHALIQPNVNFDNLALAVIDEQHRFGVAQRGLLRGKGTNPHLLVMTATPIPRTLALTLHADLDLSVIDEMPPGRTPVDTQVWTDRERERAYSFIMSQVDAGRQAFIVYPLVQAETIEDEAQAAVDAYERLSRDAFSSYRLGLLHGRLRPDEKEAVMARFKAGELDILVSTSVVEVGIDIPNASVILIEGANRFGLAQLHQFRGRVGRGQHESYCLLIGDATTEDAQTRLEAMARTTDGFELAEVDFQLRGAGELLGTRQSGTGVQLRFGGQLNPPLVALAQREARTLYEEDPGLSLPEHRLLAERVAMWLAVETDLS
ncbi:ATP-dependent DNA helicase RecG [Chloroflexota bacterium]